MLHQIINLLLSYDLWPVLLQLGCIAIWKPKGVQIAKKYLQNCFENNKDGAGFAYAKDGKVTIVKGYFEFDEFWKSFNQFQRLPMLIHFRIATHGKIDQDNCHPFPVLGEKYALVHNGIMPSSLHSGKKDESDTKQFANILSKVIEMVPFEHPEFSKLVEEAICWNKVAVLRDDGKVWLFNAHRGEWHKGAWYSNHTYASSTKGWEPKKYTPGIAADDYWHRMGYGSNETPVYSTVNGELGHYDTRGEWQPLHENSDLTDEELEALADMEAFDSCDESAQERHVRRWLALQDAKSKRKPKKVKIRDDGYHPHPFVSGSTKGAQRAWRNAPEC